MHVDGKVGFWPRRHFFLWCGSGGADLVAWRIFGGAVWWLGLVGSDLVVWICGGIIVGFNVTSTSKARRVAEEKKVEIRLLIDN